MTENIRVVKMLMARRTLQGRLIEVTKRWRSGFITLLHVVMLHFYRSYCKFSVQLKYKQISFAIAIQLFMVSDTNLESYSAVIGRLQLDPNERCIQVVPHGRGIYLHTDAICFTWYRHITTLLY